MNYWHKIIDYICCRKRIEDKQKNSYLLTPQMVERGIARMSVYM